MKRFPLAIFLCTLIVGCTSSTVDLSAVRKFAKQVDTVSASIDQIPGTYAQACDTMIEYGGATPLTLGMLGTSPPQPNNFTTRPVASLGPPPMVPPPPPTPAPSINGPPNGTTVPVPITVATPTAGPSCKSVHDVANVWKKSDTTVELYVKGLGKVAGVTTAPSQSEYTSFADSVAADGLLPKTFAEAASSFIVAIGNRIIAQEQQRDLVDLVDASQQNDILNVTLSAGENAAINAHTQYNATLLTVNSRYNNVLSPETLFLGALKAREEGTPNAQMLLSTHKICPASRVKGTMTKGCLTQAQVESWYSLETQINSLRLEILHQRADWTQVDQGIQTSDNQLEAYVNTMRDIGQINASLVKHKTGFAGLMDEIKPWVDDLAQQASKLASASSASASSSSSSTHVATSNIR